MKEQKILIDSMLLLMKLKALSIPAEEGLLGGIAGLYVLTGLAASSQDSIEFTVSFVSDLQDNFVNMSQALKDPKAKKELNFFIDAYNKVDYSEDVKKYAAQVDAIAPIAIPLRMKNSLLGCMLSIIPDKDTSPRDTARVIMAAFVIDAMINNVLDETNFTEMAEKLMLLLQMKRYVLI